MKGKKPKKTQKTVYHRLLGVGLAGLLVFLASGSQACDLSDSDEQLASYHSSAQNPYVFLHHTATDKIYNRVAHETTHRAVKSGPWEDPNTWNTGTIPSLNSVVDIRFHVYLNERNTAAIADFILVSGCGGIILRAGTTLKVGTLILADEAILRAKNIDPLLTTQIIIRNMPLDLTHDPKQFSVGLIAIDYADVKLVGAAKTTQATQLRLSVASKAEPKAGDTVLTLERSPSGWNVGDRIVLPPTDPVNVYDQITKTGLMGGPVETEEFQISGISGNVISLNRPLKNNHTGAYDAKGNLDFLPHVGNLSRNIVIKSENPMGTRGHTLFTGHAHVNIEYVEFKDLGRTLGSTLDNTTFDHEGRATRIGSNQIGRYALHIHHLMGPKNETNTGYQYKLIGNSIADGKRWGLAIHESHFGFIYGNTIYNMQNAGLSTESGNESYNVIEENLVIKVGAGFDLSDSFWFGGPNNYIRNNVAASAYDSEYVGHGFHLDALRPNGRIAPFPDRIPLFRGADTSMEGQYETMPYSSAVYLEFAGNEAYAMDKALSLDHYMLSGTKQFHIKNTKAWGLWSGLSNIYGGRGAVLVEDTVVRKTAQSGYFQPGWAGPIILRRADIQDNDVQVGQKSVGIAFQSGAGGNASLTIEDCILNNPTNILIGLATTVGVLPNSDFTNIMKKTFIQNVKFDNPLGNPFHAITLELMSWNLPSDSPMLTNTVMVNNFNRVQGDDFQVYWKEQDPHAMAIAEETITTVQGRNKYACPGVGLTNQQCMDTHGRATGGSLARGRTERDGIIGAYVSPIISGPIISGPTVSELTSQSAKITWSTDKPATRYLEYGLNTGHGFTSTWNNGQAVPIYDSKLSTTHSIVLSNSYIIRPNTQIHYRIKATDAHGNETVSNHFTFTTPKENDSVAPSIGNIVISSLTSSKATIMWTTSEEADTRIEYGKTLSYGLVSTTDKIWFDHTIKLENLESDTLYHYRIVSKDRNDNRSYSNQTWGDLTFRTKMGPKITVVSPQINSTIEGTTVELSCHYTGDFSDVDHLHYQLDDGTLKTSHDLNELEDLDNVTAGNHSITGFLHTANHTKISGSDFSVSFKTVPYVTPIISGPIISGPTVSELTPQSAKITWSTDKPATRYLEYGLTTTYGFTSTWNTGQAVPIFDSKLSTTHSIVLSNSDIIRPNTQIHYRIKATDAFGNETVSGHFTFTTPKETDSVAPSIGNIVISSLTSSKATIMWTTSEEADTRIEYGKTLSYELVSSTDKMGVDHTIKLENLESNTLYHYRIVSKDRNDNRSYSNQTLGDLTFRTKMGPKVTVVSPQINSTIDGTTVKLACQYTGDLSDVDHLHYQLDDGTLKTSHDLNELEDLHNVTAGNHSITGFLHTANHTKISGSDFSVSFNVMTRHTPLPDPLSPENPNETAGQAAVIKKGRDLVINFATGVMPTVESEAGANYELSIYNRHGEKIRLFNIYEQKPWWDGLTDSGEKVGTGIYFIHIQDLNNPQNKYAQIRCAVIK